MPATRRAHSPNDGPLPGVLRLAVTRPLRESALEADDDGVGMGFRFLRSHFPSSDSSPEIRLLIPQFWGSRTEGVKLFHASSPGNTPAMKTAIGTGPGDDFMDYHVAVDAVLERASRVILPGDAVDVVTMAEREIERHGACDSRFMKPIEHALHECMEIWTIAQKRAIWRSTGSGRESEASLEDIAGLDDEIDVQWIDLGLEGELMRRIVERLSGGSSKDEKNDDDDDW